MKKPEIYRPNHKIRIVTAASLFDGHDVAINIMRRIMQRSGAEIIHLGHNRSAREIVNAAIQEDVQGIAITSYQGGHEEFFKYVYDLLQEEGSGHIKIFGGGGGTILPEEIKELEKYGICRIYSPDDGRKMGLQGMINDVLKNCDFELEFSQNGQLPQLKKKNPGLIARLISTLENNTANHPEIKETVESEVPAAKIPVIGITGTGGAGKSSLVDEIVRRFVSDYPKMELAILSVDPTKRKTGGALLGDRIRMNAIHHPNIYMRSLATRQSNLALSKHIKEAIQVLKAAEYDLIILETSGIGQGDTEIVDHSDVSLYVMTPDYGASSQLEKIDMLDFADFIAINKFDKRGALDALRDVRKQYTRNHLLWDTDPENLPVFGTIASQFNDPGTNQLYLHMISTLQSKFGFKKEIKSSLAKRENEKIFIIPPGRVRYLSEISEVVRKYNHRVENESKIASDAYALKKTLSLIKDEKVVAQLRNEFDRIYEQLEPVNRSHIETWDKKYNAYQEEEFTYQVRGKDIHVNTFTRSLSGTKIPRICLPKMQDWGDRLKWILQENVPGEFPYTSGVYPFKRKGEDPTRMFAGEGEPERTNRRFHYLASDMDAKRLSTAFDSVTLYGEDPDFRPDIYGKIGNSGVSICCLDDAKKLYSGFNLCDPKTSVSMTINGPATIITAFFMNAAIDQQCELYIKEHGLESLVEDRLIKIYDERGLPRPVYNGEHPDGHDGLGLLLLGITGDQILEKEIYAQIKSRTLNTVRGTVQADILKEDQAQNTCIFSTEFSLKMMGDVQQYFVDHSVRNFYSVSISGYHIAEAGANPITQLAFTLANGFTYVEYYLSRGMHIDEFAHNLSYFFSNGIDAEYAVIGRVARKIWSKAMNNLYKANERSQKLKYHIQTSGRSLHAQEISFNDIRTTLQALYAIYDNCNSLHTNAYDEAITTPTEESVRRAIAIQLIINKELGLAKNENPLQGSFIIEELTDLVEEAVLAEFDRITERGGVLGAMESMYQRSKIQEESLHYETLKHSGDLPVIGVNTFLSKEGSPTIMPKEVIRSTEAEKKRQIKNLESLHKAQKEKSSENLRNLKETILQNQNAFAQLLDVTKYCSLGQITHTLFEVGGQYRRNM